MDSFVLNALNISLSIEYLFKHYLYNSVAIFVASPIFLQSINQNRADTVVVNDTQSLTNVRGVDPVTSSHCARVVPPNKYNY